MGVGGAGQQVRAPQRDGDVARGDRRRAGRPTRRARARDRWWRCGPHRRGGRPVADRPHRPPPAPTPRRRRRTPPTAPRPRRRRPHERPPRPRRHAGRRSTRSIPPRRRPERDPPAHATRGAPVTSTTREPAPVHRHDRPLSACSTVPVRPTASGPNSIRTAPATSSSIVPGYRSRGGGGATTRPSGSLAPPGAVRTAGGDQVDPHAPGSLRAAEGPHHGLHRIGHRRLGPVPGAVERRGPVDHGHHVAAVGHLAEQRRRARRTTGRWAPRPSRPRHRGRARSTARTGRTGAHAATTTCCGPDASR